MTNTNDAGQNETGKRLTDNPRFLMSGLCLIAISILITAYMAQHGLGIEPCTLCLYQRIPYWTIAFLTVATAAINPSNRNYGFMFALCALVFVGEAGIAFYHTGVEQHWWAAITACSGEIPANLSLDQLRESLMKAAPKRCDQIDWTIFGLSITVYNIAVGLIAAAGCVGFSRKFLAREL